MNDNAAHVARSLESELHPPVLERDPVPRGKLLVHAVLEPVERVPLDERRINTLSSERSLDLLLRAGRLESERSVSEKLDRGGGRTFRRHE